jgi:hypothetical protein
MPVATKIFRENYTEINKLYVTDVSLKNGNDNSNCIQKLYTVLAHQFHSPD